MAAVSFTLFPTAIGLCAVVWSVRGVAGVALPQGSEERSRRHLERRFANARHATPPPRIADAVADITALLDGEARDLGGVDLDMAGVGAFEMGVYDVTRRIPPGETVTYGEIALRLGAPGAARAVGRALGANPFPIIVPCHRVLGAGGKAGGFSARGGLATNARLLTIERARTSTAALLFHDLPVTIRPAAGGG